MVALLNRAVVHANSIHFGPSLTIPGAQRLWASDFSDDVFVEAVQNGKRFTFKVQRDGRVRSKVPIEKEQQIVGIDPQGALVYDDILGPRNAEGKAEFGKFVSGFTVSNLPIYNGMSCAVSAGETRLTLTSWPESGFDWSCSQWSSRISTKVWDYLPSPKTAFLVSSGLSEDTIRKLDLANEGDIEGQDIKLPRDSWGTVFGIRALNGYQALCLTNGTRKGRGSFQSTGEIWLLLVNFKDGSIRTLAKTTGLWTQFVVTRGRTTGAFLGYSGTVRFIKLPHQ